MEHEIEIKLSIAQESIEKLLSCVFFSQIAIAPITKELTNIYFDTNDWQLRAKKIALRIRRSDEQYIQTLKTSGTSEQGLSKRLEWEWDLSDDQLDFTLLPLDVWPDVAAEELVGQFTTTFTRQLWYVEHRTIDGAQAMIEIALDQGHISAQGCEQSLKISELELELKSGDASVLVEVASILQQQCAALTPSDVSKAARGFELLASKSKH
jgi:inorganic triphosphatase YgiF